MFRLFKALIFLAILSAAAIAGGLWWYAHHPMAMGGEGVELTIPPGSSMRSAARLAAERMSVHPDALVLLARALSRDTRIKAGSYEIEPGTTPLALIDKLTRGDVTLQELTVPEGWTFAQFRAALAAHPAVHKTMDGRSDADLYRHVAGSTVGPLAHPAHPEGMFFPDTYLFAKGSTEVAILRRAHRAMLRRLDAEWQRRAAGVPYASPYEALIMASIVEKETGLARERPQIAGVFVNRLRKGMLLQTDPTVIYGLGAAFDGNLRKRDLQTDGPYNTYTRVGLPPTPIALPGAAALQAALNPARTDALYFVARGDGSHEFSASLEAHNRAVNRFQRRGG
ncbi:MAG: endolytic transglycosylase MltG [Burkholderiales bacterium]|nr:endolytic transglycosylase MltG [Burkholderiales bacterium]